MTGLNHADLLHALLKRIGSKFPPAPTGPTEDPLEQFIYAFLVWEAGAAKTEQARKRMAAAVVDLNEFRVCLPDEIVSMLGERYPLAQERARRMKAALNDIFVREHAVTLDRLKTMNKREARQYLETLDGLPPFVSARVSLLSLGVHAAPVDDRLLERLIAEGVLESNLTVDKASSILERAIKASDAIGTHLRLQTWAEDTATRPAARSNKRTEPAPRPSKSRSAAAGGSGSPAGGGSGASGSSGASGGSGAAGGGKSSRSRTKQSPRKAVPDQPGA